MGCKILLIGIDGSPSCGINLTGLNEEWYGEPRHLEYRIVERPGVFMELLEEQMEKRGVIFEKIGLPLDVDGDLEKPLKQLKEIL
jgi:predicted secreted protein